MSMNLPQPFQKGFLGFGISTFAVVVSLSGLENVPCNVVVVAVAALGLGLDWNDSSSEKQTFDIIRSGCLNARPNYSPQSFPQKSTVIVGVANLMSIVNWFAFELGWNKAVAVAFVVGIGQWTAVELVAPMVIERVIAEMATFCPFQH